MSLLMDYVRELMTPLVKLIYFKFPLYGAFLLSKSSMNVLFVKRKNQFLKNLCRGAYVVEYLIRVGR